MHDLVMRGTPDPDPFPTSLCDALFAAVLIDDEVDDDLALPNRIQLDFSARDLVDCFRLARQMWSEGFDRAALIRNTNQLIRTRDLDEPTRVQFKHIRARFKHLRYAHALYSRDHRYPALLDRVTITMGQVQDAYRHHRSAAVLGRAALLRLFLQRPAASLLKAQSERLVVTTPEAFRRLLQDDYRTLAKLLEPAEVSGRGFHAARKVVGRQVSFWDTLRTLAPTEDRYRLSRWLSAINGLMGALHDDMVERRAQDRTLYDAPFALPENIRRLIAALVRHADTAVS